MALHDYPAPSASDIVGRINSGDLTYDEGVALQANRDHMNSHGNVANFDANGNLSSDFLQSHDITGGQDGSFSGAVADGFQSLADNVNKAADAASKGFNFTLGNLGIPSLANVGDFLTQAKGLLIAVAFIGAIYVTYKIVK